MRFLLLGMFLFVSCAIVQSQNTEKPIKFPYANGIPASPKQIQYLQPDSSLIHIYLKGDKKINWAVTHDGYTALSNPNGYYYFAKINRKNNLVESKLVVKDSAFRSTKDWRKLRRIPKGLKFTEDQIKRKKNNL